MAVRALAALALAAVAFVACSGRGADDPWDPEGIYSAGELSDQAVRSAREYRNAPLLWLGEEFQGLRLTYAEERYGIFTLIYGDCDSYKANPREPSCFPAVQLQLKARGLTPPVEQLTPQPSRSAVVASTRGVQVYSDGPNIVVQYANGMSITGFNLPGDTDAFLQALQSANHEVLGVAAVGPGEPLDAFTSLE